jgi:hypothetical protein
MMKDSNYKGNKISRREFLKLLGAAIATIYFAYPIYFLNGILGKSSRLKGAYAAALTRGMLDEDGILMMGSPKPGGYSYRFDITKDPTFDKCLDMAAGAFEFRQEGSIKFVRFTSTNPGNTGQGRYTVRFHIFTEDRANEDEQKYNWTNGAAQYGWLTTPKDLSNGEWTYICRPNGILNPEDSIVAKLGGGRHSRQADKIHDASCWNVHWSYNASIIDAVSFEFDHPSYEHGHTVKLFNKYQPLGDKWFGCKVVSIVNADKSARHIVTYFNEDPIDNNTGKPKNEGWKKYFEFIHTGQGDKYTVPHTWGGAKNTWRNDWLTSIDIAYMNHREISTSSNPV